MQSLNYVFFNVLKYSLEMEDEKGKSLDVQSKIIFTLPISPDSRRTFIP